MPDALDAHYLARLIGIQLRLMRRRRALGLLGDADAWSIEAVSRETGIDKSMISKYENGLMLPTLPRLYSLAAAYGVSARDLIPPHPPTKENE